MKAIAILIILAVGGYFGWQAIQTKPDAGVPQAVVSDNTTGDQASGTSVPTGKVRPIDNENVKVTFKGFGPGKVHDGSFTKLTSNFIEKEGGIEGDITVDMTSITTGIDKLNSDLKSKTFFDVTKYPTAKFKVLGGGGIDAQGGIVIWGDMTIKGITKKIEFPVTKSNNVWNATFTINMKDFGIDQTFANETIELSVVVPLL